MTNEKTKTTTGPTVRSELLLAEAMHKAAITLLFHVRGIERLQSIKITGADDLDKAMRDYEAANAEAHASAPKEPIA